MKAALFPVRPLKAMVIWAKSSTKPDNWLAKPRKDRISVIIFQGQLEVSVDLVQLCEELQPRWNRFNSIMNRRKRVNWSYHILVQFNIVRDYSHFHAIWLWHKESRRAPLSWSGFFGNDL